MLQGLQVDTEYYLIMCINDTQNANYKIIINKTKESDKNVISTAAM